MTDTEKKALALVTQLQEEDGGKKYSHAYHFEALCRAIEQHEAFRQEVSDALMANTREIPSHVFGLEKWVDLQRFIIPKTKPDPLVEAWIEATGNTVGMEPLNAALEARGLEIRSKNDDRD